MSGSRALPLLCRKTTALPTEVLRLVREYLRVPVGPRCPRWISVLLWAKLRTLPQGTHQLITVSFRTGESIEYSTNRHDKIDLGTKTCRPCHLPSSSGLPSSGSNAVDSPMQVDVWLDFTDRRCRWQMRCKKGSTLLRAQGDISRLNSFTALLSEIREYISGRRSEPCGFAEVPTTWHEWHSFIRHWLFGPPAWKQTTLNSWLGCPSAAPACRQPRP